MQTKTRTSAQRALQGGEAAVAVLAMVAVPLFHWPGIGGSDPFVTAKALLLGWLVGLLAVMRAGRLVLEERIEPRAMGFSPAGWLVLGWAGVSLISLWLHPHPAHFFRQSLLQWMFLLWIWLLTGIARPGAALRWALHASVLTGTAVAAIALVQAVSPRSLARWLPYEGAAGDVRHVVFATIGNPEHLGGYLAAVLVIAFGLALRPRAWLVRAVLLMFFVLQLIALMRTGARGAWLGALVGVAAVLGLEILRRRGRRVIAKAAIAAVCVLVLAGALLAVFSTPNPLNPYRADFLGRLKELRSPRSESVRHRLALIAAASRMIAENPLLGVGPGRFPHEFFVQLERMEVADDTAAVAEYLALLQGRDPDHAHNDPLEFWAETGTLGLLFFICLVGHALAAMRRGVFSGSRWAAQIAIAFALGAAILTESLFAFPLHLPTRGVLFWTLLILGAMAAGERTEETADAHPVSAERV